jgi:hypothetical protein
LLSTIIVTQRTEITQFIFGRPLRYIADEWLTMFGRHIDACDDALIADAATISRRRRRKETPPSRRSGIAQILRREARAKNNRGAIMGACVKLAATGGTTLGYRDGLVVHDEFVGAPRLIDSFQKQVGR